MGWNGQDIQKEERYSDKTVYTVILFVLCIFISIALFLHWFCDEPRDVVKAYENQIMVAGQNSLSSKISGTYITTEHDDEYNEDYVKITTNKLSVTYTTDGKIVLLNYMLENDVRGALAVILGSIAGLLITSSICMFLTDEE